MIKRFSLTTLVILVLLVTIVPVSAANENKKIGVNVALNTDITDAILADIGAYGKVRDVVYEIDALTMQIKAGELASIHALCGSCQPGRRAPWRPG